MPQTAMWRERCAPGPSSMMRIRGLRIALCGLQDEHVMPDTWRVYRWQSRGGWSNSKHHGRDSGQPRQECVWFSPGCLPTTQLDLLSAGQACIDGPLPA